MLVFDYFNKTGEKYKSNIHLKILIEKDLKQVKHFDEWDKRKKTIYLVRRPSEVKYRQENHDLCVNLFYCCIQKAITKMKTICRIKEDLNIKVHVCEICLKPECNPLARLVRNKHLER